MVLNDADRKYCRDIVLKMVRGWRILQYAGFPTIGPEHPEYFKLIERVILAECNVWFTREILWGRLDVSDEAEATESFIMTCMQVTTALVNELQAELAGFHRHE